MLFCSDLRYNLAFSHFRDVFFIDRFLPSLTKTHWIYIGMFTILAAQFHFVTQFLSTRFIEKMRSRYFIDPSNPNLVDLIWSNYSDLTRPGPPNGGDCKGIPLISGKSRLVKYYEPFGQRFLLSDFVPFHSVAFQEIKKHLWFKSLGIPRTLAPRRRRRQAPGEVISGTQSASLPKKETPHEKSQDLPSLKLTAKTHKNRPKPNRNVVFQPSIFRDYVSFREGIQKNAM